MPRNRVQHQKGLSDDAFERLYPDENACRKAWFAWRWPEGFKCPRCAGSKYCEIRGRQLLQCQQCRHQTSLIAGTVLQGTKLPMRVWFRAMHLLGFPPVWAALPCSDGMNDASITEYGVVRGSVHKRGYGHKQATAAPIVAGVSEAGDCSGKPGAGCVSVAGSAALT